MRRLNFRFGHPGKLKIVKFPVLPPESFAIEEIDAETERLRGEKPFDEYALREQLHQLEDAEA